jgi:hypothetical protein
MVTPSAVRPAADALQRQLVLRREIARLRGLLKRDVARGEWAGDDLLLAGVILRDRRAIRRFGDWCGFVLELRQAGANGSFSRRFRERIGGGNRRRNVRHRRWRRRPHQVVRLALCRRGSSDSTCAANEPDSDDARRAPQAPRGSGHAG